MNFPLSRTILTVLASLLVAIGIAGIGNQQSATPAQEEQRLTADDYYSRVRAAWQVILVANYTGLEHEGIYLEEPSAEDSIELVMLEQWPTDDDTSVEWVDLHIMEMHGLAPSYEQIRDEWIAHLNYDIWVSTRKARDLMDEGVVPPETGSPELNPDGAWSIDAQLQTELFGLISPGMPDVAMERARYFARVTNSGFAVEASAFYASMYADAFFKSNVVTLINDAQNRFATDSEINETVDVVRKCHAEHLDDWRTCRLAIRDLYDHDPEWWGARVNFASAIMALLYGNGDLMETMTIGSLAGWDADNNVTTGAGLLALISGYEELPEAFRNASDIYYNEDVTGHLPKTETVAQIAKRTQALAEAMIRRHGGEANSVIYVLPAADQSLNEQH